jgi:lipase maturation factor 1
MGSGIPTDNAAERSEGARPVPVMLFDGDCGFCRGWIERWRAITGDRVRYEPYQEALARYPRLTEERCREAVQLVMPDGSVVPAARGVFTALALAGRYRLLLRLYERAPLFGRASEWVYRFVARHRTGLSRLGG